MTSLKIRAAFALALLLTLCSVPAFAQADEPTAAPVTIEAPETAPVDEVSTPAENPPVDAAADRLVRVVEILTLLIIALMGSGLVAIGAGGAAIIRLLFDVAAFLTSLTPTPHDDAAVKRGRKDFDAKYPSTSETPRDLGRDE